MDLLKPNSRVCKQSANNTIDCRRYFRPFFIDPATQKPTSQKLYYDIASFLVTQLIFSYTTTPFLVLSFAGSVQAWSRVYFYAVIGTVAGQVFFSSPARSWLKKKIEARNAAVGVQLKRSASTESLPTGGSRDRDLLVGPGLSSDVQRDLGEMVGEAKVAWKEKEKGSKKE